MINILRNQGVFHFLTCNENNLCLPLEGKAPSTSLKLAKRRNEIIVSSVNISKNLYEIGLTMILQPPFVILFSHLLYLKLFIHHISHSYSFWLLSKHVRKPRWN